MHVPRVWQVAYVDADGVVKAVLLHMHQKKTVPPALAAMLRESSIVFTGRRIQQDLEFIRRDFDCIDAPRASMVDLADMARERDLTENRKVSLDTIVQVVLKHRLCKDPEVRLCNWNSRTLLPRQQQYAVSARGNCHVSIAACMHVSLTVLSQSAR